MDERVRGRDARKRRATNPPDERTKYKTITDGSKPKKKAPKKYKRVRNEQRYENHISSAYIAALLRLEAFFF